MLAAGGAIRRDGEIVVVHRPRYDDWSLPKGKLDEGEDFEAAALREVEEETGLMCSISRTLGDATYRDNKGRAKLVRYFEMEPLEGNFFPNEEVDELRWVPLEEASRLLSYEFDRELIAELS